MVPNELNALWIAFICQGWAKLFPSEELLTVCCFKFIWDFNFTDRALSRDSITFRV